MKVTEKGIVNERVIGLSIKNLFGGDHNHPQLPNFLNQLADAIYAGEGKRAEVLKKLDIDRDFAVKLLVGIPSSSFSREKRLLTETFCGIVLGRDFGDNTGIWTNRPSWSPVNHKKILAPLEHSRLDVDWMLSLGVSRPVWENNILCADACLHNVKSNQTRPNVNLRHLLTLSSFGFSDPYQFFTKFEPI